MDPINAVIGRELRQLLADAEWRQFGSLAASVVAQAALSEGAVNGEINRLVTAGEFIREGARVRLRDWAEASCRRPHGGSASIPAPQEP